MAINNPDFLAGYSLFYESARYGGDFMAAIETTGIFPLSHNFTLSRKIQYTFEGDKKKKPSRSVSRGVE